MTCDSPCTVGSSSSSPGQTHTSGKNSLQSEIEDLVSRFTTPFPQYSLTSGDVENVDTNSIYVLTGGNGTLGVNILIRLLKRSQTTVYCILRGDGWDRLEAGFKEHARETDHKLLSDAKKAGNLRVLSTRALCSKHLGLSEADYKTILQSADAVIHAAWPVNFNLSVSDFAPFIQCSRELAELCTRSPKKVRYHFVGSIAATYNYPAPSVPEAPVNLDASIPLHQGYAIAKLVTEHVLMRLVADNPGRFNLSILRVGQICGNSSTGYWSPKELLPMMISSLPLFPYLPLENPHVSWIPSDVCASALVDIVESSLSSKVDQPIEVFHLANPNITSWEETANTLGMLTGIGNTTLLPWEEYVEELQRTKAPVPMKALLPHFQDLMGQGSLPKSYANLETFRTAQRSSSLRQCSSISFSLLEKIVSKLVGPLVSDQPAAFIFGPWSALRKDVLLGENETAKLREFMEMAHSTAPEGAFSKPGFNQVIEKQLTTLAVQVAAAERIKKQYSLRPVAVSGYSYGEYAAAVIAGALSAEEAVGVLVSRAYATADVEGAMLNVFCDACTARSGLARMDNPPSLAIIAGPTHTVLSGSKATIQAAQSVFARMDIKTHAVMNAMPFHSSVMDAPVRDMVEFAYTPRCSDVMFVSGLAGTRITASKLGFKYWQRHMCGCIEFFKAMQYIKAQFPGATIVDIGPTAFLTQAMKRYGWKDVVVSSVEDEESMTTLRQNRRRSETFDAHLPPTPITSSPRSSRSSEDLHPPTRHSKPTTPMDTVSIAVDILHEHFGYRNDPTQLLPRSLHSLGLQSLDFIVFSEEFKARTNLTLSLSSYVSDDPLSEVLRTAALKA